MAEAISDYGRVSALTGLPAVLGWASNVMNWRRSDLDTSMNPTTIVERRTGEDDTLGRRQRDLRELYESGHPARVRSIVRQYGIDLIFVGQLELQRLQDDQPELFPDPVRRPGL